MTADDSAVDRADIAADLERARIEFHRLLSYAERHDAWAKPTRGTHWTNEQLLFHMVFGYMVVQRLLVLVKVFNRLPDEVSRSFARVLKRGDQTVRCHQLLRLQRSDPGLQPPPGWGQRWTRSSPRCNAN